jgi:hypothetical protein
MDKYDNINWVEEFIKANAPMKNDEEQAYPMGWTPKGRQYYNEPIIYEKSGFDEWHGKELEDDYANLQRLKAKLDRREKKLDKRKQELDERERKLNLTPSKRLKEALELEAALVADRNKFEIEKQGHKAKVKDFRAECKQVQKNLDRAAELVESECRKTIQVAEKELEAAAKQKTKELEATTKEQKQTAKDLKNEEKRLTQIRHDLSDREANLVRRETAVRRGESSMGVEPSTGNGEHRALEI